jgi:dipeptidyl aminopeptidase/acylaminoacyl peptidase
MTQSATPRALPFGSWRSPITAADVARQNLLVSFPVAIGGDVWWQERLPDEKGRTTVVRLGSDGERHTLLPAPWNARNRVHEYGGRSYLPVPASPVSAAAGKDPAAGPPGGGALRAIVFANYADQRLYYAAESGTDEGGTSPRPLTPVPGGTEGSPPLRYADMVLSPDGGEIWCVQERHQDEDGKVSRAIVAVPLDGSAAEDAGAIRELVTGPDFFAFPTPSPDGRQLAWIGWNHPRMPWDGTELRVAVVEDGVLGRARLVKGSIQESVVAPLWRDDTSLYVVSDWPGWWNIYQVGLVGEPAQALYPAEEEFADPLWQLGQRPYGVLGDGKLAVLHGCGGMHLGVLDPETGEMTDLDIPYPVFESGLSADGSTVVGVAAGPTMSAALIRVDTTSGKVEVLCAEAPDGPDPAYLPVPRQVDLEGKFGRTVHAVVYPPANPKAVGPKGKLPPYVVWAHGGPTSHVVASLDLEKAYFTSRGIGVVDVNYGGSTGYGRSYRERLRMQWGVVDVEDVIAAAHALADAGEADGTRLAIRGGSAGGWTALAAVTTQAGKEPVFSAATSYFGVADLSEFASQTHDFESRYLNGLIGPLPGFEAVYQERSPAGHVSAATSPILLLQGLDDPIVPPAQSEAVAAQLAEHGIRHALLAFEGESHGFRRVETIIASLEAELSFYGQVLGFTPPGIPAIELTIEAKTTIHNESASPEPDPAKPQATQPAQAKPSEPAPKPSRPPTAKPDAQATAKLSGQATAKPGGQAKPGVRAKAKPSQPAKANPPN